MPAKQPVAFAQQAPPRHYDYGNDDYDYSKPTPGHDDYSKPSRKPDPEQFHF